METKITKDKRIVTPMPECMADRFEALCKERGQTMSGVIKALVWDWIETEDRKKITEKFMGE